MAWYAKAKAWVGTHKDRQIKDFALATKNPRPRSTKKRSTASGAISVAGAVGAEKFVNSQDQVALHVVHRSV